MSDISLGMPIPSGPSPGAVNGSQIPAPADGVEEGGSTPFDQFADVLKGQVDGVNEALANSDQKVEAMLRGEETSIHEVMIAMTKADISFRLMTQVGRKVIEAYQEISRMQV